jgi:hypothetical protein
MSRNGQLLPDLHSLGRDGMGEGHMRGAAWVPKKDLPAADDGDGHQRHDEHNPSCCRASNQRQLLPQF